MSGTIALPIAVLLGIVLAPFAQIWVQRTPKRLGFSSELKCSACAAELPSAALIPGLGFIKSCVCGASNTTNFALLASSIFLASFVALTSVEEPAALLIYLVVGFFLSVLSAIDMDLHILPNIIVWPMNWSVLASFTVLSLIHADWNGLFVAAIGAVVLSGILFLSFLIYPKGMGLGDVKLAITLGLLVGWLQPGVTEAIVYSLYVILLATSVAGFGGLLISWILRRERTEIPFGPFLVAGTLVVILAS